VAAVGLWPPHAAEPARAAVTDNNDHWTPT